MLATPAAISAATVHLNTTGNRPPGASVNTFRSLPVPPRCSQGLIRPSISRPQGILRDHDQHPDLRKTRMCPSVTSSTKCPYSAEDCRFAHSQSELRVSFDRFYKVQPCAFYDRGKCRNGDLCRFAHGHRELRNGVAPNCDVTRTRRNVAISAPFPTPTSISVLQESAGDGGKTVFQKQAPPEMMSYIPSPSKGLDEGLVTTSFDLSSSPASLMGDFSRQLQTPRAEWSPSAPSSPRGLTHCLQGTPLTEKKKNRDEISPSTCPGDEDIVSDESSSSSRSILETKSAQAKSTVWSAVSNGSDTTNEGTSDDRRCSGDSTSISSEGKDLASSSEALKAIVRQCSLLGFIELRHALKQSVTYGYEE